MLFVFLIVGSLNLGTVTNQVDDVNVAASFSMSNGSPPVLFNETPTDNADDVTANDLTLIVMIDDPEGNTISWKIETKPDLGSNSGICSPSEDNPCKATCQVSGLYGNVTYQWFVNVSDGENTVNATYSFTTRDYIPLIGTVRIKTTSSDRMPFEAELYPNHGEIRNWTAQDHKYKINIEIVNNHGRVGTKEIWFRVNEWKSSERIKLIDFFLPTGIFRMENFNPDIFDFPKCKKLECPVNGPASEKYSMEFVLEVTIIYPPNICEIGIFFLDKTPGGFPFSFDFGGFDVYF